MTRRPTTSTDSHPVMATHTAKTLSIDVKLTDANYNYWRSRMVGLLVMQKLATVVEDEVGNEIVQFTGTTTEEKHLARFCITGNLSEPIGQAMIREKDPKVLWNKLERKYSGLNAARKIIGIRNLCKYSFERSESVDKNISTLKGILYDLLTAAGSLTIDYEEIACAVLLHSLPAEYGAQRTAITEKKLSTIDEIEIELLKEEQILQASDKGDKNFDQEFSGATFKKRKRTWPAETEVCGHNWDKMTCNRCNSSLLSKNSTCKDCNETGHKSKNSDRCVKNPANKNFSGLAKFATSNEEFPLPFKREFAGMTTHNRGQNIIPDGVSVYKKQKTLRNNDLRWVIDSGCTKSLLRNKGGIENYQTDPIEMAVANTKPNR